MLGQSLADFYGFDPDDGILAWVVIRPASEDRHGDGSFFDPIRPPSQHFLDDVAKELPRTLARGESSTR